MFGANLVVLTQICDELLCGQVKFMDRRTDADNDITPPPHGLKGQGLKMESTFKAFAEAEQQIALTEDKLNIHCSS